MAYATNIAYTIEVRCLIQRFLIGPRELVENRPISSFTYLTSLHEQLREDIDLSVGILSFLKSS